MKRILIVTSGPLCRNPRVLKEATALGEAGYDVTVLAPARLERSEAFDRDIMRAAPFRKLTVDLLPRPGPVGWRRMAIRSTTWLARRAGRFGIESAEAFGPVRALARAAAAQPADLTLVHTELGLAVGARLLAAGRRVAVDFEDWHSRDLLPQAQEGRPRRLLLRLEAEMIRKAAYASAPSEAMAAALHAAYGGPRPVVIRNVFPLQPEPGGRPHAGPPAFLWFSQTIGAGRMLEPFLAAWRLTKRPSRLCLLGDVSSSYREKLLGRLPSARRSSLEFRSIVAPAELPGVIARHDIGLALEPKIPDNKNLTSSNKIFQYFNAGLGVLASDTAGQREALEQAPGAGRIIPLMQTAELAAELDALLADAGAIAAMGRAARRAAVGTLSWEREKPRLLAAVAAALESRPPSRP